MADSPTTTITVDTNDLAIIRSAVEGAPFKGKAAPFVAALLGKLLEADKALAMAKVQKQLGPEVEVKGIELAEAK